MKKHFASKHFAADHFASGQFTGTGPSGTLDTEAIMPVIDFLYTYYDLIQHLVDDSGSVGFGQRERRIRMAIEEAQRDLIDAHDWQYTYAPFVIRFNEPYSTGTVAYDHTGGTYERMLTLTSGTWPTWARYGHIRIDSNFYQIDERMTSTVVTLLPNSNPGQDVASGTTYTLYQSRYPLPSDFRRLCDPQVQGYNSPIQFVPTREWQWHERGIGSTGTPRAWTTLPEPNALGKNAIVLYPYPQTAVTLGGLYQRMQRMLRLDGYQTNEITGSVTIAAGNTTITGTGTSFTQAHVGAVLRVRDGTNLPDGAHGEFPFYEQRVIKEVVDADTCRVSEAFLGTYTTVKYRISDPLDVPAYMNNAMLRGIEYQLSILTKADNVLKLKALYEDALERAKQNDLPNIEQSGGSEPSTGYNYPIVSLDL